MSDLKKKVLSLKEGKEGYDNAMKLVLSDIGILSRILSSFVPEFKDIPIKDIEDKYIERKSVLISRAGVADVSIPTADTLLPKGAISIGSEPLLLDTGDTGLNQADIYYDVLFRARYPGRDGEDIGLYINIEAQGSMYPGYPLEMRAVYYGARLLSSQLKVINDDTNYGILKKVYSIWLCIGAPMKDAGTVSLYSFKKDDILRTNKKDGKDGSDDSFYDLISVIILRINEKKELNDRTLRLLQALFSREVTKARKLEILKDNGLILEEKSKGGLEYMCSVSELFYQEGIEEGQERLNSLNIALMNEGKIEILKQVMYDKELRDKLYKIYGL